MLKNRASLGLIVVALMLFTMLMAVTPVFAIANPDNVTLNTVAVFRNVAVSGDTLWVVRYAVVYSSVPTETAASTFMSSIYTGAGSPTGVGRPLTYYQYNLTSIYLNTTNSASFTWGGSYQMKVMGQPAYFTPPLTEGITVGTKSLTASDWYEASSLTAYLMNQVHQIEIATNTTLRASDTRVNNDGAVLVLAAVPGLNNVLPDMFTSTSYFPSVPGGSTSRSGADTMSGHIAPNMQAGFQDIGRFLGVNATGGDTGGVYWVGLLITTFGAFMLGGLAYIPLRNPIWSMAFGGLALPLFYWMGWFDLTIAIMIGVTLAIIFGVIFILGRL